MIPLSLALIAGILLGGQFPVFLVWIFILTWGIIAALVIFMLKGIPTLVLPILLFYCAGYLSIQPWVSPRFPPNHVINLADQRSYMITGTIDDTPVNRQHNTRFVLRMNFVMKDGLAEPVCGRIRVTVSGDTTDLRTGDEITFYSKIRSNKNFNNPGAFNYKRYLAFKNVWGRAYTRTDKISVRSDAIGTSGRSAISGYRRKISGLIRRSAATTGKDGDHVRAVLNALLIGDKTQISMTLRDAFNRAGIGHLLAISGLHIGIVAVSAFFVLRWLVSFIKPLLWWGWSKKTAAVLSFFPILMYGLLAGMSPSTQRAVIMVGVFLLAFLFDRDQDLLNTIAVAAMIVLVLHPPSLFSISFQLSFAAVLSIAYGLSCISGKIFQDENGITNLFGSLLVMGMVTLFATAGTAPLVMHYFNQVSLIGLPVNMIMAPVIGFVVVPVGMASICIYLFSSEAAFWCMKLCAVILDISIHVITFFSGQPFAAVKTVTPNMFEICLAYALLWGLINLTSIKLRAAEGNVDKKPTIKRFAVSVTTIAAVLLCADVCYWVHTRCWNKDLRITVLDVGQGSASLLELPGGYNLLIDGGGFSDNAVFDTGRMIVAPFLWRKKIKTIDTILLSHAHSDHLNGLIYIAEHFQVKQAITNHEPSPAKGYMQFVSVLKKNRIAHSRFETLPRDFVINKVGLHILHPEKDFMLRNQQESWRNLNNNSIVVKVVFGGHSFLFPGDIMAMGEKSLVDSNLGGLRSDVLLVPHHGSAASSTPLFVSKVNPEAAIISAGWMNRFGFPNEAVVKRYQASGCRLYRTDINGAVRIWSDGEHLKVRPMVTGSN